MTEKKSRYKKKMAFRATRTYDQRLAESKKMKEKFPDRVPIIVEARSDNAPCIDKRKFMTPHSLTCAQFIFVIRRRMMLPPEHALFFYTDNGRLVSATDTILSVAKRHTDDDGFLYITYDTENAFG